MRTVFKKAASFDSTSPLNLSQSPINFPKISNVLLFLNTLHVKSYTVHQS